MPDDLKPEIIDDPRVVIEEVLEGLDELGDPNRALARKIVSAIAVELVSHPETKDAYQKKFTGDEKMAFLERAVKATYDVLSGVYDC